MDNDKNGIEMRKRLKSYWLKSKQGITLMITGYLLLAALAPHPAIAQYVLDDQVSLVYINGTSTLHDWTVSVKQMKGTLQAQVEGNRLVKISSVNISMPTTALESGKETMNKNTYKALKSDKYPEIAYRLDSYTIHNGAITTKGKLTIAGVTKSIATKVTQQVAGKHIKIDGEVKLKMSDFNVKPPEFLLGAFKTGDEITITFHFMFCEKN